MLQVLVQLVVLADLVRVLDVLLELLLVVADGRQDVPDLVDDVAVEDDACVSGLLPSSCTRMITEISM